MTQNENPYQAPATNVGGAEILDTEQALASRWLRLFAAIIDTIIILAFFLPILFFSGVYDGFPDNMQEPDLITTLFIAVTGIGIFLLFNAYLIQKNGQTIGKMICKIKIVRSDYSPMGLKRYLVYRYLPITFVAYIPIAGGFLSLLDVLFIFRQSKQCVHDTIADTIVIDA